MSTPNANRPASLCSSLLALVLFSLPLPTHAQAETTYFAPGMNLPKHSDTHQSGDSAL